MSYLDGQAADNIDNNIIARAETNIFVSDAGD
jgi:hypothetical protein